MKTIDDLSGKHYITCAACMTVLADGLSWANAHPEKIAKTPEESDNIIVESCQVTDLAVLNDFRTAERLQKQYPNKKIFISGCLAKRLDIEMPEGMERLQQFESDYVQIKDKTFINFEKPFWIKDFKDENDDLKEGNIFRHKYPLRIGKGCPFDCAYCTIKFTRSGYQQLEIEKSIKEFEENEDVVLIADSPNAKQIADWCELAIQKNKKISIRNLEPQMVLLCKNTILKAAKAGLIDIFHSPIQSNNPDVIRAMKRSWSATKATIDFARELKEQYGVKIATNIIVDYQNFPDDFDEIYKLYDYISWNPYWDGNFDRKLAEERFQKYLF